jgi:hypothetical protein
MLFVAGSRIVPLLSSFTNQLPSFLHFLLNSGDIIHCTAFLAPRTSQQSLFAPPTLAPPTLAVSSLPPNARLPAHPPSPRPASITPPFLVLVPPGWLTFHDHRLRCHCSIHRLAVRPLRVMSESSYFGIVLPSLRAQSSRKSACPRLLRRPVQFVVLAIFRLLMCVGLWDSHL